MDSWFFRWRNKQFNKIARDDDPSLLSQIITFIILTALGVIGICTGGVLVLCIICLAIAFLILIDIIYTLLKKRANISKGTNENEKK